MRSKLERKYVDRRRATGFAACCAIVLLLLLCGVPSVQALDASAIVGRWQTADTWLVIDINRCGEEFCGRRVVLKTRGEQGCERAVLRVKLKQQQPAVLEFAGQFDLADQGGHYTATMFITNKTPGSAVVMHVQGRREDTSPFARILPLDLQMSRAGDAVCEPTPTS